MTDDLEQRVEDFMVRGVPGVGADLHKIVRAVIALVEADCERRVRAAVADDLDIAYQAVSTMVHDHGLNYSIGYRTGLADAARIADPSRAASLPEGN